METIPHSMNWVFGWSLILIGFATGAGIGLFFHQPEFWGGYASFRRRIVRLGHISCAALGMMNVLYSLAPLPSPGTFAEQVASVSFIVGGLSMPIVCFLTGWRSSFRHLFFVPVTSLITAVSWVLIGSFK